MTLVVHHRRRILFCSGSRYVPLHAPVCVSSAHGVAMCGMREPEDASCAPARGYCRGFRANAFVTISLPFAAFLLWVELNRERRPHLYRRVYSPVLIIATGVAFAAWMIVRNMLGI